MSNLNLNLLNFFSLSLSIIDCFPSPLHSIFCSHFKYFQASIDLKNIRKNNY